MILNNAPQNEAILSNVGEIGEFRIRNSAKAFNILSSGLYANKIKAIIRELSCNAVDSHVAAGKVDVPFDVHLPNALSPHFAIRDYGTGLSHEQVTQIYTTYFESTKTNSNEFIGALGLGSKSPFSYTDNFTVTAIKDGIKGIYSAFINAEGVPSIALMMTEQTDEQSGVEIKFSVNDRYDFHKFKEEAESVYKYFKLRPNVEGATLNIRDRDYETKDLLPGVSVLKISGYRERSVALMGNIAYPIEVPNADTALGEYASMLNCALEIEFGIGEVDFQASREGLSYIPQTIEAIKNKLIEISKVLSDRIASDANAIENKWDRAVFLSKKNEHALWKSAVALYIQNNPLETVDTGNNYNFLQVFEIPEKELALKYNILVRAFNRERGNSTCSNIKIDTKHIRDDKGGYSSYNSWGFRVSETCHFVLNDTKIGAGERAKYHYRENEMDVYSRTVYVLEKANDSRDMDTAGFFAAIHNPPTNRIFNASELKEKPRRDSSVGRNVSLLRMETRRRGYGNEQVVWSNAGKVADYSDAETHYYIPMSGYTAVSTKISDPKDLRDWLKTCGVEELRTLNIFGVRKVDMAEIQKKSNWVNVEKFIEDTLKVPNHNIIMNLVSSEIYTSRFTGAKEIVSLIDSESPFTKVAAHFENYQREHFSESSFRKLYAKYGSQFNLNDTIKKFVDEISAVNERYPLLKSISGASNIEIAEYVNLIDNVKGI